MTRSRRQVILGAGALPLVLTAGRVLATGTDTQAASGAYGEAILRFTAGVQPRPGKIRLEIATLIDNGNTVPVEVSIDEDALAPARIEAIALVNERNPQPEVAVFHFGADARSAWVSTRIRLATSQKLMAIARLSDQSFWSHEVEVIVTLAACIEP